MYTLLHWMIIGHLRIGLISKGDGEDLNFKTLHTLFSLIFQIKYSACPEINFTNFSFFFLPMRKMRNTHFIEWFFYSNHHQA
jgi:hypothetical protein